MKIEAKMKKILILSLILVLVAGVGSRGNSTSVIQDEATSINSTGLSKDRHIVKTSNGTIVVLYYYYGIKAKKSTDNGKTWTNLAGLSGSTSIDSNGGTYFSICQDASDNIYIAYRKTGGIYFNKLTYSGNSWTLGGEKSVQGSTTTGFAPSIIRESDGTIWVSYGYDGGSGGRVRATYSDNEFKTGTFVEVGPPESGTTSSWYNSALTFWNGNPFIIYSVSKLPAPPDEFRDLKWSSWNGSSWSAPATVPGLTSYKEYFSVTTIGNVVHLVITNGGNELAYRYYDGSWKGDSTLAANGGWGMSLTAVGSDLYCFASQWYAKDTSGTDLYQITYKKCSGGIWDAQWKEIYPKTKNGTTNRSLTTPSTSTDYIPIAWTYGMGSPFLVIFDLLDFTPPPAPTVTSATHPDQAIWYPNNAPSFSWTCSDVSGITGYSYALDQISTTIPDDTSKGTATSKSYTDVADGTSYFHIKAQNGSGFWGETSHYQVNTDVTPPPYPNLWSTPAPTASGWIGTPYVTFNWSCSDISGIKTYHFRLSDNRPIFPDESSSSTSRTFQSFILSDGPWWFSVRPVNGAGLWGNRDGGWRYIKVNIDTTSPPAPIVSSSHSQSLWSANNDPYFSWTCNDDLSGITGYSYILNRSSTTIPDDTLEGYYNFTNYTDVKDGTRYFHVKAQNGAGLWSGTTHYRINIDTTPPPAPVVTSLTHPDQTKWYRNNDPSFSWTCADISGITGYKYKLDQSPDTIPNGVSVLTTSTTNYTDVPSGTWHFHVRALNGSGLFGGTSHYQVNIDTSIVVRGIYQIELPTTVPTTTDFFKLKIKVVDPDTHEVLEEADNEFNLTARTVNFDQTPGTFTVRGQLKLDKGQAEVNANYDTVGWIRLEVTDNPDDLGRPPAYTAPIRILPARLRYEVVAPEKVQAGKEFSLTVRLIDDPDGDGKGTLVTPIDYARRVSLVAYFVDGKRADGVLKLESFYLQGGEKTIIESYNIAQRIYIEASDAEDKDPVAEAGRSRDIEVIGAPETVMKLEGLYNETKDALYLRNSTLINIVCISEIKAEYIYYIDNGSQRKTYEEPFSLSPGAHTIEYYGVDEYGNQEEPNKSKRIYVAFFGDNADGLTNIPNPFKAGREETSIEYKLKEPSNVTITIYDLLGQEVWYKSYPAGENGGKESNNVSWDGRNLSGKVVANGGYVCRIWIAREKRYLVRKIGVAK